ncbi:hypothetical protein [Polaribacter sp.]|uniref:hypothetical protein n=1 Tax=Polaribacter sp. TaxID=1920175 RepID=UPI003EF9B993
MIILKNNSTSFLVLIFFIVAISCKNQTAEGNQETKKIEKIEYFNKNDNSIGMTEFFDKKGNKIKIINHSIEYGDSKTEFLYDTNNRLTEEKQFNTNGELKKAEFHEFKAISDQEFMESIYQTDNSGEKKLKKEIKLENNDTGNLSRKIIKSDYGNWEHNYKYHTNSKMKEEIIIGYNGTEKVILSYNEKGLRTEENIFRIKKSDDKFTLELTNNWYYDKDGNEVTKDGKPMVNNEIFTKKYTYYK